MKIVLKLFLACILMASFVSAAVIYAQIFPKGIFLSVKEVEKRWGAKPFNSETFKKGNSTIRSSMAASILKEKSFIGKTNTEIWKLLGRHDGYYFSDLIPVYVIEDNSMKGGDVWQIVFFIDRNDRVKFIKVHKNSSEL